MIWKEIQYNLIFPFFGMISDWYQMSISEWGSPILKYTWKRPRSSRPCSTRRWNTDSIFPFEPRLVRSRNRSFSVLLGCKLFCQHCHYLWLQWSYKQNEKVAQCPPAVDFLVLQWCVASGGWWKQMSLISGEDKNTDKNKFDHVWSKKNNKKSV